MRLNARVCRGVLLFVVMAGLPEMVQAAMPWFQGVGDLPGGTFSSGAYSVSADGSVVGGTGQSASGDESFRWTKAGGIVGLGNLSGGLPISRGAALSGDGAVAVGISWSDLGGEAFRWTQAGGMVGLGLGWASDVSHNGSVIVGQTNSEAFRWTQATGMVGLGFLPNSTNSQVRAVSGDGTVAVGFSPSSTVGGAFRWTQETGMTSLGDLPGGAFGSIAYGISSDGETVVGLSYSSNSGPSYEKNEAFRWTESGGMVGLGDLVGGDFNSLALDASHNGALIVGKGTTATGTEAFIWDAAHGMRNLKDMLVNEYGLDLTGWTLNYAAGISDDGTVIVGAGINPSGNPEGWVVSVPEPSTFILLGIGAISLLGFGLWRRIKCKGAVGVNSTHP